MLNYESQFGRFPTATRPTRTSPEIKQASTFTRILPQLDQSSLFRQYDFDANWFDEANSDIIAAQLSVFECPSTPDSARVDTSDVWTPLGLSKYPGPRACADYGPLEGVGALLTDTGLVDTESENSRGVLQENFVQCRIADITDGTSSTILIGEDAGRPVWYVRGRVSGADTIPPGAGWADDAQDFFLHGAQDDARATPPGPCAVNCHNNGEFYGFHSGIANALFADGHARFLSASMDIRVVAKFVSPRGHEVAENE
jgi:prepilin-type processing-associated H-X9-DG protein